MTGVYEIWIGPYFYQGSSNQLEIRRETHYENLKKGKHTNRKMQSVFNKYKTFKWQVLVECESGLEKVYEQDYIDSNWGDKHCLNLSDTAYGPRHNIPHTPEGKANISASLKGKSPWNKDKTGLGGHKLNLTDEQRKARSERMKEMRRNRSRAQDTTLTDTVSKTGVESVNKEPELVG